MPTSGINEADCIITRENAVLVSGQLLSEGNRKHGAGVCKISLTTQHDESALEAVLLRVAYSAQQ